MITKPERIIKRIIKAVGKTQSVLLIGNWSEELIKGTRENQNSLTHNLELKDLNDNSFTRIIADYSDLDSVSFFTEARRLLLPTGFIIISANCEDGIIRKFLNLFKREINIRKDQIKPKILQDQIHDNGFLIDGYYGYPGGHLLMIAQIQNKEVTTLFASDKQETIVI